MRDADLPRLAGALRRARRALDRADRVRNQRRLRALRRAARGVDDFATRLQSRGGADVPAAVRAALAAESSALSADLASLVRGGGR